MKSSIIIDLKAELFRKQEEFKQQKIKNNNASFIKATTTEKKPTIWSKQNAGVLQRAQKDIEAKVEEEDQYEKSRKALERKTKLYEQISKGKDIPEEDGSKHFLVDFQKKVIDNIRMERDKKQEEERRPLVEDTIYDDDIPPPKDEGEEWVDYTDSLGRSRRCMKKDLPKLVERDKNLQGKKSEEKTDEDVPTLMSNDMRKEMLRQKWEQEELEAMNGPIHYSNVRFDEIRTHGVGFFEFDKTVGGRQEQLDTLNKLRKQTVEERSKKERLKEKRKAMLDARLAKVKQRKLLREGGTLGPDVHLKDEEADIGPKIEEMVTPPEEQKPELLVRVEKVRQNKPTREWDKGKETLFPASSEETYYKERRQERNPEFAPPVSLYAYNTPKNTDDKIKRKFSPQSILFDERHQKTVPIVKQRVDIVKQTLKGENQKTGNEETTIGDSVSDIPLPGYLSVESNDGNQRHLVNDSSFSIQPPFNFSVPPPNMAIPNVQPTQLQNQQFPSFTSSAEFSTYQSVSPVVPGVFTQSNYQTEISYGLNTNYSQQAPVVSSYQPGSVTQTVDVGNTQTVPEMPVIEQPPKPKLNIIDPRFIQNKDVLSQNPGNLSREQSDQLKEDNSSKSTHKQCDEDTCIKDTNPSSSYSAQPVVYK